MQKENKDFWMLNKDGKMGPVNVLLLNSPLTCRGSIRDLVKRDWQHKNKVIPSF